MKRKSIWCENPIILLDFETTSLYLEYVDVLVNVHMYYSTTFIFLAEKEIVPHMIWIYVMLQYKNGCCKIFCDFNIYELPWMLIFFFFLETEGSEKYFYDTNVLVF